MRTAVDRWWGAGAGLALVLSLPVWAAAQAADPYVLLDEAKLTLANGDLNKAQEQLEQIPLAATEEFIAEEVLVHELLITGANLTAASYLQTEVGRMDQASSAFGTWLAEQQALQAERFAALSRDYLARTASGPQLDFIRFRLPFVSAEHLQDATLFADPQVLGPAVQNWADGREGLGHGVLASQARVALVLAAAVHYDLTVPSAKIEAVALRLKAGVPFHQDRWLDWLAETAKRGAQPGDALNALAAEIDRSLLALPPTASEQSIRARATERLQATPEENSEEHDPSD